MKAKIEKEKQEIKKSKEHRAVMENENAALLKQINEERALKQKEIKEMKSMIEMKKKEVADCRYEIHTKDTTELSKAYLTLNRMKREFAAQNALKDERIKELEHLIYVASESQMTALVVSEPQMNA